MSQDEPDQHSRRGFLKRAAFGVSAISAGALIEVLTDEDKLPPNQPQADQPKAKDPSQPQAEESNQPRMSKEQKEWLMISSKKAIMFLRLEGMNKLSSPEDQQKIDQLIQKTQSYIDFLGQGTPPTHSELITKRGWWMNQTNRLLHEFVDDLETMPKNREEEKQYMVKLRFIYSAGEPYNDLVKHLDPSVLYRVMNVIRKVRDETEHGKFRNALGLTLEHLEYKCTPENEIVLNELQSTPQRPQTEI